MAAHAASGQGGRFRRLLEQSGLGYGLAVPKSQQIFGPRIDHLFAQAPMEVWGPISCGDGTMGPRLDHWTVLELPTVAVFGYPGDVPVRRRWVLVGRSLSESEEIAYFLAYVPRESAVATLVRFAGMRWQIEECFQAAENECGLDRLISHHSFFQMKNSPRRPPRRHPTLRYPAQRRPGLYPAGEVWRLRSFLPLFHCSWPMPDDVHPVTELPGSGPRGRPEVPGSAGWRHSRVGRGGGRHWR